MNTPLIASVLHLDRQAIKQLRITDPYSIHRVVYSLFDDVRDETGKNTSQPSGILYADGKDFNGWRILLLSDRSPHQPPYGQLDSKPVPEDFLAHAHYRFKTIVNPTQRDRHSGKLKPIRGREAVARWFIDRAPQNWGFELSEPHFQVDRIDVLQFTDKGKRDITLAQAHLHGQLTVIDADRFQTSFRRGIGRGRAFGCGLLQIAPIIEPLF